MRESHITFRDGLFDPQPMRTFKVHREGKPPLEVRANMANQTENGSLVFLELKGGLAFTVRACAAGQWSDFEGSVPTEDEIRSIRAFSEREHAISEMLKHDGDATRM